VGTWIPILVHTKALKCGASLIDDNSRRLIVVDGSFVYVPRTRFPDTTLSEDVEDFGVCRGHRSRHRRSDRAMSCGRRTLTAVRPLQLDIEWSLSSPVDDYELFSTYPLGVHCHVPGYLTALPFHCEKRISALWNSSMAIDCSRKPIRQAQALSPWMSSREQRVFRNGMEAR
jgi:hypothetical protein